MKGTILRISAAVFAISACLAIAGAQSDGDLHNHHIVAKKVTLQTKKHHSWAYSVEHRGHKKTTARKVWTSRPTYRPHEIYTKKEWEARIREARERRKHHHHPVVWTNKHDNGKHKGWYIGRGNPHRDRRWPGKGKGKDRDHDKGNHDKGDHGKGHGHSHGH
jgi:hypothetical protein